VARVIQQPADHAYRRRAQPRRLAHWDPTVTAWLDAGLPIKRMLELARADPTAPYTGSPATWYRYVHCHQQARAAAAAKCTSCRERQYRGEGLSLAKHVAPPPQKRPLKLFPAPSEPLSAPTAIRFAIV
jgi:hypothetical protein